MIPGRWKVAVLIILCVCGSPLSARSYFVDAGKVTVAVFPFRNLTVNSLEEDMAGVIERELANHAFIEIVPVTLILNAGYEIEPLFLWTEMNEGEKMGGMLWEFRPFITEETSASVRAEILIYGDMIKREDGYRLDVIAIKERESEPAWSRVFSPIGDDELSLRAAEAASELAAWVKAEYALRFAEEDVRRYRGGMVSLEETISLLRERLETAPQSIPLHTLLIDMYRMGGDVYEEHVLREAEEIVGLLDKGSSDDHRYLISRDIDPYDIVARALEKKEEWKEAIVLRERALREFPANFEVHTRALERMRER